MSASNESNPPPAPANSCRFSIGYMRSTSIFLLCKHPGEGVVDEPLSEDLKLCGGVLFAGRFPLDLVLLGVDMLSKLIGWPTRGISVLAGFEAGLLDYGVAFDEGHGLLLVPSSGSFLGCRIWCRLLPSAVTGAALCRSMQFPAVR